MDLKNVIVIFKRFSAIQIAEITIIFSFRVFSDDLDNYIINEKNLYSCSHILGSLKAASIRICITEINFLKY